MELRKLVYHYIEDHPHSTVFEIQNGLNVYSMSVMSAVNKLCKNGNIKLAVTPLNLGTKPDRSCYYSVCKKLND